MEDDKTEKKTLKNDKVLLTIGTKEMDGRMGPSTARFIKSGPEFDIMKTKFSFPSRALEVTVTSIKQTI